MLLSITITDTEINVLTLACDGATVRTDTWPTVLPPHPAPPAPYYAFQSNEVVKDFYEVAEVVQEIGDTPLLNSLPVARFPKCMATFYDERTRDTLVVPPPPMT